MNTTMQRYDEANQALDAVLDAVPVDRWRDPSPCEGWAAGDVIRHMIQTQREFLSDRGFDVGIAPDPDVDPAAAWRNHAERVIEVLRDDSVVAAAYDGYFGPTTVGATMEQFYIWDMLVHRWDVATSAGLDAGFTDAELDRIEQAADTFGEGLHMEGICKPGVEALADDDRTVRLLARLGRRA